MSLIAKDIAQGSSIQLNRNVSDVLYDAATGLTTIWTWDNYKYTAQRVIVTCPLA
jgi:hypothetical protein